MAKTISHNRKYRQHRVQHSGAILPIISVWGYSAIVLGFWEVQVHLKVQEGVVFCGALKGLVQGGVVRN